MAGNLAPLHMGFSVRLLEHLYGIEASFPQSKQFERPREQAIRDAFYDLDLEDTQSLLPYSIDHTGKPCFRMGGSTQGHGYSEVMIIGTILKSGDHT